MKAWQWIALGGLIVAATKTANAPTAQVERISRAIARAEGFGVPGAIPTVRNNPGNIRSAAGPIATYETPEAGWAALYRQVTRMLDNSTPYYRAEWPLPQIAKVYTGEAAYINWARNVAAFLGVAVDTPFKDL